VNKPVYIYWNLRIRERIGDERNTWFDDEEDKDLVEALLSQMHINLATMRLIRRTLRDYDI
jgi:hypothetical protein